jgi:outer membrane protein insertion porin family
MSAGLLAAFAAVVTTLPGPAPEGLLPEGALITSVQLEVPESEKPRLLRYVEIKAGDTVSATAVRRAVELLHATGEFVDVGVLARPDAAGIVLVLRPSPAPLLADVRVESRALSPKVIRRVARLRPREPLWPARLEEVAQLTALDMVREGYLEARVTAVAQPARRAGSPWGAADAVFRVVHGPRARIGAVTFEGVPGVAAGFAAHAPRPGAPFVRARAEKAAESVRRTLAKAGRWEAVVVLRESYDPGTARVALTYEVHPGPIVGVDVRGVRPPGSLRGTVETLVREGRLRGDALEEAADRIEEYLHRKGHRNAAVVHHEETSGTDAKTVVYEVTPGPLATVASVALAGEGAPVLGRPLATRAGAPLQDRLVDEDVRSLTRALEDVGHAEAQIEAEVAEGGGLVPVVYSIRAGPRVVVKELNVALPAGLPTDTVSRELRLRVGEPYRLRSLVQDRDGLLSAYRNLGYLQAVVTPEVVPGPDGEGVSITLRVVPGPRTLVDRLITTGLHHTREEVVRRELLLTEGQPLGLQKLLESQRRLGALGLFQSVRLTEMDPESVDRRSLLIAAEEAPRTTVAYGVGYAERDFLRGSVEVTRRNLFGMDRSLSTFARASFRGSRFLTTFREPYLFGRRQELLSTGYREEEERDGFSFVRYGALLQTVRRLSTPWSLIVRYTYQQTSTFAVKIPLDEVDRQYQSSTVSGPSASVVNDTRDDPLDPRRGHFLGADVQFTTRFLGGDTFLKGFVQVSRYTRLSARVLVATGARLGLARTFGLGEPLRLPIPDRFFAGGPYSLRGFETDSAGPLEPTTSGGLAPAGGNALLLGGAELRVDAGRSFALATFLDAGNAYRLVSDMDLGDVRYTAGLGLRYRTALGPLRIDWGYKLNPRGDKSRSRFHFTVGHAF